MNENGFDGLHQYFHLKSFYDPLRLCRIPGRVQNQPGFFAQMERRFSATNHPEYVIPKRLIWPQITQITQIF